MGVNRDLVVLVVDVRLQNEDTAQKIGEGIRQGLSKFREF